MPGHNNVVRNNDQRGTSTRLATSSPTRPGRSTRTSSPVSQSATFTAPSPKAQSPAAGASFASDSGGAHSGVAEAVHESTPDGTGVRSCASEVSCGPAPDVRGPCSAESSRAADRRARPLIPEPVRNWVPERRGARTGGESSTLVGDRRSSRGSASTVHRPSSPAMSSVSHSSHMSGVGYINHNALLGYRGPAYVVIVGRRPGVYTNMYVIIYSL